MAQQVQTEKRIAMESKTGKSNALTNSKKRLLLMAGGTGGHLFPGLAVAHYLMAQGWQVRWLGTADRMEAQLIPQEGIEIDFIRISGVRGKGAIATLMAPTRILRAIWQARRIIRRYRPHVVLGMGGYVSGPGGVAARLSGVPLVVHEQNGVAGLTNRGLAKIASRVLQAFPDALPAATVVGNPIRRDLLAMVAPEIRFAGREGPIRVLVTGGSQGAQVLNRVMPQVAQKMGGRITLWHQAGKGAAEGVGEAYQRVGQGQHRVDEFIVDMVHAYAWADIVICRSGALTVSEIMVVGIAAIFVPFMHKDRQQYWNALPLQEAQAAEIIEQPQLDADRICALLMQWERPALLAMARRGRALAITDATERVAGVIMDCVRNQQNDKETVIE